MAVDTAEGAVPHIQADFADGRDSQYLTDISLQVQNRLRKNELVMTDLLADAGYSNGPTTIFSNNGRLPDGYPFSGDTNLK